MISLLLISSKLIEESDMKNEVQKLFDNLPIDKGILTIIENSKYEFDHGKSIYQLGYSESWSTNIERIEYLESLNSEAINIELELNQNSIDKKKNCYNTSLRLNYKNEEVLGEEFYKIKENFEKLGDKIDAETILTEENELVGQTVFVYFNKGQEIPNISFSFYKESNLIEHQIFINYQNCLN